MKHKYWHKIWHDRLLSDPDYLALPPAARGVLADLRCFAGRADKDGSTGMTAQEFIRWYGGHKDAVENALKSLGNRRLLVTEPETFCLRIPNWDKAQESPSAARQRRYVERQKGRHNDATMTRHNDGRGRLTEADITDTLPASQGETEGASTKEEPVKKYPVWQWWVVAHRNLNRPDPVRIGPDLGAATALSKLVTSGDLSAGELQDCMALYLGDTDPFLERNGHGLRFLGGRLNAYRKVLKDAEPPPLDPDFIDQIEADAAEYDAKHRKDGA